MNRIQRVANAVAVGMLALTLAGCASGPRFTEMQGKIPPLAADAGRIYVYRTAVIGAAVQPKVKINGEIVGSAAPDGVFYVDRPPGAYTITTSSDPDRPLHLTLDTGQSRYVRLDVGFGFLVYPVYPELVADAEGEKDVGSLHYTGY